jgi:hypothetical protein
VREPQEMIVQNPKICQEATFENTDTRRTERIKIGGLEIKSIHYARFPIRIG